jgi:3-mercaptopyruvate sulfurtransferase SseA
VRALLGGWNAWLESRGAVEEAVMPTPETSGDLKGNPPAAGTAPKTQDTPGATTAPAKKTTKSRTKRRRTRT